MMDPAHIEFSADWIRPPYPRPATLRVLQLGMAWFAEQPGGLDRYYLELLRHLPASGVSLKGLVCGSPAVQKLSKGTVHSAIASGAPLPLRLAAFGHAVKKELREFKPEVVATHFALYAWPALRALENYPLVVHFHGPWFAETLADGASRWHTWAKYRIERAVYRRADAIVTLSHAFKETLVREFAVDEGRVCVIPGGVDVRRFDVHQTREQARDMLDWPRNRPIALAVRRLANRMGLENLIQAAKLVREAIPDALLLIAGKGKLAARLQQCIDAAELGRTVKLLGFLPDEQLPLAYRAADISVVPSMALEGFGLVAAESLAAGTPAVVTPVGGLPEIVEPLRPNLVARDSGSHALAETIIEALDKPSGVPSSAECRRDARRFDWATIADMIHRTVYSTAVGEPVCV